MAGDVNAATIARVSQVCAAWETANSVEPIGAIVECRSVVCIGDIDATPRFVYLSIASPLEQVLGSGSMVVDRSGAELSTLDLETRLLDREVAAVLTTGFPGPSNETITLSETTVQARAILRRANVQVRFLIRQIGLAEVSSHRGAPARLYDDVASMWSPDLSLFTDPAMLLTLGADRQRYVDANYTERATDRLPRALGRLRDLGVQSYPRLVIV